MHLLFALVVGQTAFAADAVDDPMLTAMTAEIERAMAELANADLPPYFIALEATDRQAITIRGEDGALHGYSPAHSLRVDGDVRIGSRELDSTHALRSGSDRTKSVGRTLPITEDVELLRHEIWREIDARYQDASERWSKVQTDQQVLVDEEGGPDLVQVSIATELNDRLSLDLDAATWEGFVRDASTVLAADDVVRDGVVTLSAVAENRWFASSEGAAVRHGWREYRITAQVDTIAEDGAVLSLSNSWSHRDSVDLPSRDELVEQVTELHDLLAALRLAPEQEPYTGPAILSDRASGVFFHEIFGHRMEGHRLKRVDNAQTFRDMVGEPILPAFLSVHDDPTEPSLDGIDLRGHYLFDNEGVASERTTLVKNGVLEGFLQSRSTVEPSDVSNGHGRRQPGKPAVTRQGNLMVSATSSVTDVALRKALIKEARAQGLEYGLMVDDIQGGFTYTSRSIPNAFNVNVLVGHRVYVDGRPDELVRGIDLIGTPLVTFSRIIKAGERTEVFNGTCGAESGWVPVSASSPALLVQQIETQRKARGQNTPPLLPGPKPKPAQSAEVAP